VNALLVRDATLVPMDGPADDPVGHARIGCIRVRKDRIADLLPPGAAREPGEGVVDARGLVATPGFVQGHVHFCQTLFRGLADDLPLMDWLRERIWPLEAAHDARSTAASAELSLAELVRGGTTTVQVMESVHHAEESFAAAAAAGVTATLGNCLMDVPGDGVPPRLVLSAGESLRRCEALIREFHGRGRLRFALSPRFILSCSEGLARDAAALAAQHGLPVHTHAAEHPAEVSLVQARFGRSYVTALHGQGLLGPRTSLAHCVHTTDADRQVMLATGTAVLHCPSANLKLGSGIAPIAAYARAGLRIALGADGAPCNNRLSALTEARQAALLQACAAGPGAWPAARALEAATCGGARALGLENDVGSLAPGKRADILLFDLESLGLAGGGDLASRLVYAATEGDLRHVLVGGRWAVRDGELVGIDGAGVRERAEAARSALLTRAGLAR
jgi:5-methylthioadenosine/S-adenosylhomocysteine deaminase